MKLDCNPIGYRLLVGLVGRAGAGKSTVAHHLVEEHAFTHIALANPIVEMIGALFEGAEVPSCWLTERGLKEVPTPLGFSYRRLAQTLGTEWGRGLAEDFWLRIAAIKLATARRMGESVVISDVRFPNEAAWIVQHGGFLLRVLREPQPGEAAAAEHASEAHWQKLPVTHELHNHTSKGTLFAQVDAWLDTFRVEPATATLLP